MEAGAMTGIEEVGTGSLLSLLLVFDDGLRWPVVED